MSEGTGFTALVVEDDPTHQILLRRALTDADSPFGVVQIVESSVEAETLLHQMEFDVVLVDNRIPGRRGLDLISDLQKNGIAAPFVLMTAAGTEDLAVRAYRSHVADYVVKSADFWRDVPRILERVVETDRARKAETQLRHDLERANTRFDELVTDTQLKNEELKQAHQIDVARMQELERLNQQFRDALHDFNKVVSDQIEPQAKALKKALSKLTKKEKESLTPAMEKRLEAVSETQEALADLLKRLKSTRSRTKGKGAEKMPSAIRELLESELSS